ncbi:MAG: LuxR C-terminal-related transcriptional regulator [Cyclobacteriaceae bacterium]
MPDQKEHNTHEEFKDYLPIQEIWEGQNFGDATDALKEAKEYIETLSSLMGSGPYASIVLDLHQSKLAAVSGDFSSILGLDFTEGMPPDEFAQYVLPEHNSFIATHFGTYLHYVMQITPVERSNIEFSVEYKYRRGNTYYWINQRILKSLSDSNGVLRYVVMQYTDITATKEGNHAVMIAYDVSKNYYIVNEVLYPKASIVDQLTPTEISISKKIAQGKSDMEIAEEHCVQRDTIKQHKKNIFRKLGIHKSTELALLINQSGLMSS